jgi:hypothetical protein
MVVPLVVVYVLAVPLFYYLTAYNLAIPRTQWGEHVQTVFFRHAQISKYVVNLAQGGLVYSLVPVMQADILWDSSQWSSTFVLDGPGSFATPGFLNGSDTGSFAKVLSVYGFGPDGMPPRQRAALFAELDLNADGKVTMDEFYADLDLDRVLDVFQMLDRYAQARERIRVLDPYALDREDFLNASVTRWYPIPFVRGWKFVKYNTLMPTRPEDFDLFKPINATS